MVFICTWLCRHVLLMYATNNTFYKIFDLFLGKRAFVKLYIFFFVNFKQSQNTFKRVDLFVFIFSICISLSLLFLFPPLRPVTHVTLGKYHVFTALKVAAVVWYAASAKIVLIYYPFPFTTRIKMSKSAKQRHTNSE